MKKIIVIAAAGKGSRLGAGIPKCLIEVNGHAIFEYQLKAFAWADEIRMVVGYKAEEVMRKVQKINPHIKFIVNNNYESTNTLQSNYLGIDGVKEKVMFIDGDMIISRKTAQDLKEAYEKGEEFAGVAADISEEPVYADVKEEAVQWFDFEKKAMYEWANVALLNPEKVEYLPTYFFVQIGKFLPIKAVEVERLEIDTAEDYAHAETVIKAMPEKYDFWNI